MRRTRDWIKFGALVVIAVLLAVGFTSIVDLPRSSLAQPATPVSFLTTQAPQQSSIPAARPLADLGNAFTAVAEAVRPGVVYIDGILNQEQQQPISPFDLFRDQPRNRQCGDGSGFIISSDGYILTNNHVIEECDRVDVRLFDQRTFRRAKVVGHDPLTDVAVIKIDARDLPVVSLGNSDSVHVGEWVLAVGNPLGQAFTFTVTAGIVSGRGRRLDGLRRGDDRQWSIHDFIQTDAAINRGNSGGPLVNVAGQVIGINSAIASQTGFYTGYGFAIPINLARNVADQLIASGKVTRAALGVEIQDADEELAEYVGLDEIRGVHVVRFPPDRESPAKQAGVKVGDVIVELDGQEIRYTAQLQQLVGFKRPGDVVDVTVLRKGGERRTYQVRLAEANMQPEQQVASVQPEETEDSGSFEPRLGISVQPFDRETATRMGFGRDIQLGLAVMDVDPEGPAQGKLNESSPRGGVLEIITHVNNQRVRTREDLRQTLRAVPPGRIVAVQTVRVTANGSTSRPVYIRTTNK